MMDHPNIARVLDAGATDSGQPYFVMELVQGVPITRFCDEQSPDTERTTGTVHASLPGSSARSSEGHHSPRSQTVKRLVASTMASPCRR